MLQEACAEPDHDTAKSRKGCVVKEEHDVDSLGVSQIVAVPSVPTIHGLIMAASAASRVVHMPPPVPGALGVGNNRLDLRFATNPRIAQGREFAALARFGVGDGLGIRPLEVVLNPDYPDLPITFLHELGHFIDFYYFDPAGRFSVGPEFALFRDWYVHVATTNAIDNLCTAISKGGIVTVEDEQGNRKTEEYDLGLLNAFRKVHEVWARSFTQYIVLRSKDRSLEKMFDNIRSLAYVGLLGLFWDDDEFTDIASDIDNILTSMRMCP